MTARLRKLLNQLGDTFWLIPGAMVLAAVLMAYLLLEIDRSHMLPAWLTDEWLYNGGGTGARTLLGAIASSAIGVAGTVFSITIAALTLAAGQMGPRLLQNFTRDRGNQVTLGVFLATFAYALLVLRSVRTQNEGSFTPHLALSVGVLLAFVCVATLVYFVDHMANRINVDTVVDLVSNDVRAAMAGLTSDKPPAAPPPAAFWQHAVAITDPRSGYLQQLDANGLADWAAEHGTVIRLLVRRGDYVFPGAPVAVMSVAVEGADAAIRNATALNATRGSAGDAEHAVRQLVEVAVRALSPGTNDPNTAISVLDRLGAMLCGLAGLHLPGGVLLRNERPALLIPSTSYRIYINLMFNMIRQYGASSPAVLIRLLQVLTAVASCEPDADRRRELRRHAELVWSDAQREVANPADLADIGKRRASFLRMIDGDFIGVLRH
ncbi:MAG: DUF2254 domain-containing protein [Polaromonas sp.]